VLAELSGGMDSSSIVCMADIVIARGDAECPRLDTITWYDKSNPNWGELPYFTKVEEKRGRIGHHIDVGLLGEDRSQVPLWAEFESNRFAATPTVDGRHSEFLKQNTAFIRSRGYSVTLSGIGGEFTGDGVPTPTPELQNLLSKGRVLTLVHQLEAWAEKMRTPRLPLLWEAVQGFFPRILQEAPEYISSTVPWFQSGFVRRNHNVFQDCCFRVKLFGPLPSFQHNLRALDVSRRLFARWALQSEALREVRFPYLDRDFLELMYAIPREQIVRVGQRRSLMKRALIGIVPEEILSRKKKTALLQTAPKNVAAECPTLPEIGKHMVSSSLGIVDPNRFREAFQKGRHNAVRMCVLRHTTTLEGKRPVVTVWTSA
jgi:asparagine synthase (glutamine-hydrolysing)